MKSIRIALLTAAVIAVMPAAAYAQDQNPNHDRASHDRGGDRGGDRGARPAPPQAQRAPAAIPTPQQPRANVGGGRPAVQAPPQQPRDNRGNWQGNQGRGDRGPGNGWQGNRDNNQRPAPPQAVNPVQAGQDRGQWRGNDNRNGRDDRRGDNGNRGQWNGQPNGGQWNNGDNRTDDRRGDRGQWNGRPNEGQWNNGDHRPNGNGYRPGGNNWNGNSHQWNRDGHRWDSNRWRNDNRYNWQGWRSSHRDLFRGRYYAPRGYNYRSVYAGFFLEPLFYGSNYWLADPYQYRLPPVEWPLRWVRYYNDAVLVDVTSGEVVDSIPNFFW